MLAYVCEQLVPKLDRPLKVTGAKRAPDAALTVIEVQREMNPVNAAVIEPQMVIASSGIDTNGQKADGHGWLLMGSFSSGEVSGGTSSSTFWVLVTTFAVELETRR